MRARHSTLIAGIVALTLCAGPSVRAETWEVYRPEGPHQAAGAGFRLYMPAQYDTLSHVPSGAVGVGKPVAGMNFTASYRPYAGHAGRSDADLDAVRDEIVGDLAGIRLRGETRLTVDGAPARELLLEKPDGPVVALRRVVLVGGWLIELGVEGPPGFENKPETRWFLESLALLMAPAGSREAPLRQYVICFNGLPCGGVPCPSTSALDVAAGQELQGVYYDLDGLPAEARGKVTDLDMFKGTLVLSGRMSQGKLAADREYPLLHVLGIARNAEAAERRQCAVRN
jgi:hypothetical protein